MCGIVGAAGKSFSTDRFRLPVDHDTLSHRGPDDAGTWWSEDSRVGLSHCRLSIVDLSPMGHQPMHLQQFGLTIVFNGEIYNYLELRQELASQGHSFQSQSDTEVLLAAYAQWGTDCVNHLNGMFAFAIYDAKTNDVIIARDRAGEKPLFYYFDEQTLYFASELKALLSHSALPKAIDPVALDCYLAIGFVPGDFCILKGYNKLPPAHMLKFNLDNGSFKVWRYWDLPAFNLTVRSDETALLKELEWLLEDAVTRQMVADVPVGVLLSGGVDSSLITAMAVRHSSNVRTYSIGFPGHGSLDETQHARLIARYFGTQHTELMAEPASSDLIPRLAQQFDEPLVDSSMIPTYLVSKMVREHCTVALGGDGGDELFGGYGHYSRLVWMQQKVRMVPLPLRRALAKSATHLLPIGFKGRNWLQGLDVDFSNNVPIIASYFDQSSRQKLLNGKFKPNKYAEEVLKDRIPLEDDLVNRATKMDFSNYLAEDILVKVDRASMLNSLEVRAPFLDYRLIEFAFNRVPSHLKATANNKKILLKKLTQRVLPPEFDRKRKQGFSIPMATWLKQGPFRDLFYDVLLSKDIIFNPKMVQTLLKRQDQGYNNSERLFALVQFELWRKVYNTHF
jgi:asparagine synthase (glutamine-hydrolysing)